MQKIHIKQNINFSIDTRVKVGLKHYNDPKVFIEYSKYMQNDYKNIESRKKSQGINSFWRYDYWYYQ